MAEDKLAHVKDFLEAVTLDGFGARKYNSDDYMHPGQHYVHHYLTPALYVAVKLDDPSYVPYKERGAATSTEAVHMFICQVARDGQALHRIDPTHPAFHMAFAPSQRGCWFDDLVAAFKADNPEWVCDHPIIKSDALPLDVQF